MHRDRSGKIKHERSVVTWRVDLNFFTSAVNVVNDEIYEHETDMIDGWGIIQDFKELF